MRKTTTNRHEAFTFIELLITIGVISISLPIIFGLFFINLQSQTKLNVLTQVKRNGDSALNTMQSIIRNNAISIHSDFPVETTNEVCTTSSSSYIAPSGKLYFKDRDGNAFAFYVDDNKIASDSAREVSGGVNETLYLTESTVKIDNWTVQCNRAATFGSPLITVSFQVADTSTSPRQEENASLNYYTKIKLRN